MQIMRSGITLLFLHYIIFSFLPVYAAETAQFSRNEPITPVPDNLGLDPARVALGRRLFHDPALSVDGSISCASCHNLDMAGQDGLPVSVGMKGQHGSRNAPTVLNSGLLFRQFWDGRAATLEEQVSAPLTNPVEMASSWEKVIAYLKSEPSYQLAFEKNYDQPPDRLNVSHAIAIFERSLVTPDGAFDRYLKGDDSAIDEQARSGYQYFKSYGCIGCHQGVAVGGNMYEKLGVIIPYYGTQNSPQKIDLGRFLITGVEEHKYEFKVPSLRNVTRTAPYFHNGAIATLEEAVAIMAKHQLGREIPDQHIQDIVSFLETLNGDLSE